MLPEGQRWFDDYPGRSFEKKVKLAAAHYAKKSLSFNTVYVRPSPNLPKRVDDITVRTDESLRPHYFHFTWEERKPKPKSGAIQLTLTIE